MEELCSELQETYSMVPENLQGAETHQDTSDCADELSSAIDTLENLDIGEKIEGIIDALTMYSAN